ncbi:MAG: flagellar hook-length control protein FliK [Comamonadaceae bacterium]|nr:flagellar hook-length control protein FliK [Comamonadaceae bacterium]
MLGSTPAIAPKPAAMPPAAASPQPGSAGGPSFAHFLNDQPDPQPAHVDPVPSKPDTARDATAAANAAQARRKEGQAAPAKPAAPAQGRAPDAAAAPATPAKDAKIDDDASEPADAAEDADAQTSGLDEFTQLIGLTLPAPPAVQAAATTASPAAADTDTDARHPAKGARSGHMTAEVGADDGARDAAAATPAERRPAEATTRAAEASRAKGVELAADKAAAARSAHGDTLQAATATATPAATTPRTAASADAQPNGFAALLAQTQQAQPLGAAAPGTPAAAASARVHAALQSNAFAPELGARVSLLAVNGVQQAELQLNPADMGPVAVQIVVDGAQAQVSFHAAQAETRQALQQSLPDLAAALQGQGLTLAGGGVFQQSSQNAGQREAGGSEGRDSRGADTGRVEGSPAGTAAPPARRSQGLLDTFA